MAHMADDDLGVGEADSELFDAPGQGEDGVSAVEEDGLVALEDQLDEWVDGRVVGEVAVEQGVELYTNEFWVLEPVCGVLNVAGEAGVAPDERVESWYGVDDLGDVGVVGVEDYAVRDLVVVHQLLETVAVDRDVESAAEGAD